LVSYAGRLPDTAVDIWLGHHTEFFDLEGKRRRGRTEGVNAWIDSEGHRRFVAGRKRAFEVDLEMGGPRRRRQVKKLLEGDGLAGHNRCSPPAARRSRPTRQSRKVIRGMTFAAHSLAASSGSTRPMAPMPVTMK
jgi:hypothetical protein